MSEMCKESGGRIYVLDCSGAFQILLHGEKADKYFQLLDDAELVISPVIYKVECLNVLWKYVRHKDITEEDARIRIKELFGYVDEYIDTDENAVEALHEAARLDHSTYDMLYFTLARRNGAVLLTNDGRLADLAGKEGIEAE